MNQVTNQHLLTIIQTNAINQQLLTLLPTLQLPDCMLVAGCLFQTFWNHQAGQNAEWGIKDYDIAYFDSDLSWEAEDRVIQRVHEACAHLGVNVEVRNQARIHLWYKTRFGADYPQLRKATDGIDRYLIASTCVGVDVYTGELYSTYGLDDLQHNVLRLYPLNPLAGLFNDKAASYRQRWPWLKLADQH